MKLITKLLCLVLITVTPYANASGAPINGVGRLILNEILGCSRYLVSKVQTQMNAGAKAACQGMKAADKKLEKVAAHLINKATTTNWPQKILDIGAKSDHTRTFSEKIVMNTIGAMMESKKRQSEAIMGGCTKNLMAAQKNRSMTVTVPLPSMQEQVAMYKDVWAFAAEQCDTSSYKDDTGFREAIQNINLEDFCKLLTTEYLKSKEASAENELTIQKAAAYAVFAAVLYKKVSSSQWFNPSPVAPPAGVVAMSPARAIAAAPTVVSCPNSDAQYAIRDEELREIFGILGCDCPILVNSKQPASYGMRRVLMTL